MPTLFLGHGAPSYFLDLPPGSCIMSEFSRGSENYKAIQRLPQQLNAEPSAIVIISAHWEGRSKVMISAKNPPTLLHDVYGFLKECLIEYNVPSLPSLSEQISFLFGKAGIESQFDYTRGLDHGAYIPLKIMYPNANIPVVAVSLESTLDASLHLAIGRALAPLRDQGVLLIGSGAVVHDFSHPSSNLSFVDSLDLILTSSSSLAREEQLVNWRKLKGAKEAHDTVEHFIPLLIAAGAAGEDKCTIAFRRDAFGGAVVNSSYIFG